MFAYLKINFKIVSVVVLVASFLFLCSSLRHFLFHSTAYDLGIFDQSVYLISQGQVPISSILNFHILGDHGAFIWYPISFLYKLYPSVYWLFAIQAIALSMGGYFLYKLSQQEGIAEKKSLLITFSYFLYPTIISSNFFDFHPDVIAIPFFFYLILIVRQSNQSNRNIRNSLIKFLIGALIILSCKAVLSLNIVMIGIWLIFFEKRKIHGVIAITLGLSWFIISTQIVIPYFGANDASISRHLPKFAYLGGSFFEILTNIVLKPQILITHIFSFPILLYLASLILPISWGLSFKYLSPIICGIPQLLMNMLSSDKALHTASFQYTLPIIPFLFLAVISNIKSQDYWIKNKTVIVFSVVIGFLISFRPHIDIGSNIGRDLSSLTYSLLASQNAVGKIYELDKLRSNGTKGSVLTTAKIIPHLSHRSIIKLANENVSNDAITKFDYILLNVRYPILTSSREFAQSISEQLKNNSQYQLLLQENDVLLFAKKD